MKVYVYSIHIICKSVVHIVKVGADADVIKILAMNALERINQVTLPQAAMCA